MMPNELRTVGRLEHQLERNWRALGSLVAVLLLLNGLVTVRRSLDESSAAASTVAAGPAGAGSGDAATTTSIDPVTGEVVTADGTPVTSGGVAATGKKGTNGVKGTAPVTPGSSTPGTDVTVPAPLTATAMGVTADKIKVVYYWTDRTNNSPYVKDEANLDEGEAFDALMGWINKHGKDPNDHAELMGFDFYLHGREIEWQVIQVDKSPESRAAAATYIAKEAKPFAALASHGSISTYMCETIATGGVFNLATYDFGGNLHGRTNNLCFPLGMSWELQVERTVAYLKWHSKNTRYNDSEERKYGVLWASYPHLAESMKGPGGVLDQLEAAGVNVVANREISSDLGTSQTQVPDVIREFRTAGVNTIVMPDGGAPLNFTHGAQASGYSPDYYVWPCSGQDTLGMVRLFNPGQWARASGITCYDDNFNPDLVNDDNARSTEWYAAFQEIAGTDNEPASSTSLIWFNLLPLVAGITNAGPNLTPDTFRAGLVQVPDFRYDAINGRGRATGINFLSTIGRTDHSPVGDVAKIVYSPTTTRSGSATQGAYVYPETVRYTAGQAFQ